MPPCNRLLIVGFIVTCIPFFIGYGYGAQLQSYSACYGNTDDNFIKGSCASGETIVMESVFAYAKPLSSGCPTVMTSLTVPSSCCTFDENDCGMKYEGHSHQEYYKNCDGKTTCITTPVAWVETPNCSITSFLERTNYMVAYFYCLAENDIQTISGNTSTTDAEVFLWNTGYPDGNMTQTSSYSCSVAASCVSQLRVRALNFILTSENGVCGQSLTIKDGENRTSIGCESNTDLIPTYIYDSESYYLEIEANNTLGINAGKFFLLITAIDPLANLTLACGTSRGQGYINKANIPQCSPTTTPLITTPASTSPPPSTQPSTPMPTTIPTTDHVTSPRSSTPGTGNTPAAGSGIAGEDSYIWIIVVVIVVLILVIILILLLCRDKLKERCCKEKKQDSDEKSLSSNFENPLLGRFIPTGAQIAPKSTIKPNHVAPFPEKTHNKLPPIALLGTGEPLSEGNKHGTEDRNANSTPLNPKRLPPIALFQAEQAFRKNMEKAKRKKRRLQRKKEALERRESEIQAKEATIEQKLEGIRTKERTLEKRLSGLGQSLGSGFDTDVPQQGVNPVSPQPLHRWSSILPSPSRRVTLSTLTNVITAFRPRRSDTVCIDVTNAADGKLVSTHMNEDTC